MKPSALVLLGAFGISWAFPSAGSPLAIANHGFESDVNPSGIGAFAEGDLEDLGPPFLTGWSIIATDNNAAQNNQEVAVGWRNIIPGEGGQVLSLMAGAAIAQETRTPCNNYQTICEIRIRMVGGVGGGRAQGGWQGTLVFEREVQPSSRFQAVPGT